MNSNQEKNKKNNIELLFTFFGTIKGIIVAFVIFIVMVILAELIQTIQKIAQGDIAAVIYALGFMILLIVVYLNIKRNINDLMSIKKSEDIQQGFEQQKVKLTDDIIELNKNVLKYYRQEIADKRIISGEFANKVTEIEKKQKKTQDHKSLYENIDQLLLVLDEDAKEKVRTISIQTAMSTAISPVPVIDVLLVIWRGVKLSRDIAMIYGYRPGTLGTLILLKKGLSNVAFAAVTELAKDFSADTAFSSFFKKFTSSLAQGAANGILMARFGYGVIDVCRPIKPEKAKLNVYKEIIKEIKNTFKSTFGDENTETKKNKKLWS